jgi:hypothetical protein
MPQPFSGMIGDIQLLLLLLLFCGRQAETNFTSVRARKASRL